jgi:plasmid stabilization system protein ParE
VSFRLQFRPEVASDIFEAAAWYDKREPGSGLGEEFKTEIRARLKSLLQNPTLPRIRHREKGIRWVYPRRFPHRIIYRVKDDVVLVIAVLHSAMAEHHWKKRV